MNVSRFPAIEQKIGLHWFIKNLFDTSDVPRLNFSFSCYIWSMLIGIPLEIPLLWFDVKGVWQISAAGTLTKHSEIS